MKLVLSALFVTAIAFASVGCDDSASDPNPVGEPRVAADGTTFQDMNNDTTTITHPSGTTSSAPNR